MTDLIVQRLTQAELEAACAGPSLVWPLLWLHLVAGFLVLGLVYAYLDRRRA